MVSTVAVRSAGRRTGAALCALASASGLALVTGCGSSAPEAARAQAYRPSGARIALAEWTPLPTRAVPADVQAARDRILGPDAVEPGKVKLWWFGVSSFVASGGGHLWLFDAWEPIGLHMDYVPVGREEIAALAPEAIFVGHGHFDHAADAGYIAGRSGAVVVGSEEICSTAQADAAAEGNADKFDCLITGTADTPLPGTVQQLRLWADMEPVSILQHIHSAASPQTYEPGDTPFIHVPNLLPFLGYPNSDPAELIRFLQTLQDEQGGTWAYHLKFGEFTLLWHDSTGPITDAQAGGPEVRAALDGFPGCVDVQLGAIVGFDQPVSGLRDPRLYVESAHPRVFLPSHHDAWAPVVGGGAAAYEDQWRAELETLPHPPELDYLRDPEDYMKPRVYDIGASQWKTPMPGSRCAG